MAVDSLIRQGKKVGRQYLATDRDKGRFLDVAKIGLEGQ